MKKPVAFLALAMVAAFAMPAVALDAASQKAANLASAEQIRAGIKAIRDKYNPKLVAAKTPAERDALMTQMRAELDAASKAREAANEQQMQQQMQQRVSSGKKTPK